tara:strand:+ start:15284 stop:15892 length:609 start_codon:yes stop_codon:yes gene_type:complete
MCEAVLTVNVTLGSRTVHSFYPQPGGMDGAFRVALTGTPGTGKSSVAELLVNHGFKVSSIQKIANEAHAIEEADPSDGAHPIDMEIMLKHINESWKKSPSEIELVDGHLSHFLPVDAVIVLRCKPEILRKRLERRGYGNLKTEGNIEWELLGGVWNEREGEIPWTEFDTSYDEPVVIVSKIIAWIADGFKPTSPEDVIDWVG